MLGGFKQLRLGGLKQQLEALTSGRSHHHADGERLLDAGDYAAAELSLAKALLDGEIRRVPNDVRIHIRLELAEAQRRQYLPDESSPKPAKLEAAAENGRSALDLARHEGDKATLLQCLDALSQTLADRGDLEGVEALFKETIELEQGMRRPDALVQAKRLHRIATLRRNAGQVSAAIQPLEEAVSTFERVRGAEHMDTGDLLTELGDAQRFLGQHTAAQKHLQRALRIHERECGLGSPEALHDLHLLTGSYEACGALDKAAAEHERVLGLKLRGVGADLEQIAEAQAALAQMHVRWGNHSRARELLLEALGTFKRRKGTRLAAAYEALAAIEEKSGRVHDALLLLTHASRVWESLHPAHAQELVRNLQCQAQIWERLQKKDEADFVRQRLATVAHTAKWAEAS